MSLVEQLHQERKARQQRIAVKAFKPAPVLPAPEVKHLPERLPIDVQLEAIKRAFERQEAERAWSEIVCGCDMIERVEVRPLRVSDIQRTVCGYYHVSLEGMCSSRRTADVVRPRQIAMYLCKRLTQNSFPQIGHRFGGRDHTTVMHAFRKIESLVGRDREVAATVNDLLAIIGEQP